MSRLEGQLVAAVGDADEQKIASLLSRPKQPNPDVIKVLCLGGEASVLALWRALIRSERSYPLEVWRPIARAVVELDEDLPVDEVLGRADKPTEGERSRFLISIAAALVRGGRVSEALAMHDTAPPIAREWIRFIAGPRTSAAHASLASELGVDSTAARLGLCMLAPEHERYEALGAVLREPSIHVASSPAVHRYVRRSVGSSTLFLSRADTGTEAWLWFVVAKSDARADSISRQLCPGASVASRAVYETSASEGVSLPLPIAGGLKSRPSGRQVHLFDLTGFTWLKRVGWQYPLPELYDAAEATGLFDL